jgi:hypothetical protein
MIICAVIICIRRGSTAAAIFFLRHRIFRLVSRRFDFVFVISRLVHFRGLVPEKRGLCRHHLLNVEERVLAGVHLLPDVHDEFLDRAFQDLELLLDMFASAAAGHSDR